MCCWQWHRPAGCSTSALFRVSSSSSSGAQPPQTPDRTVSSSAVTEGNAKSNSTRPAQDGAVLSASDIVSDGETLHRNGKSVTARIVVASVKALTAWDDKGNESKCCNLSHKFPPTKTHQMNSRFISRRASERLSNASESTMLRSISQARWSRSKGLSRQSGMSRSRCGR